MHSGKWPVTTRIVSRCVRHRSSEVVDVDDGGDVALVGHGRVDRRSAELLPESEDQARPGRLLDVDEEELRCGLVHEAVRVRRRRSWSRRACSYSSTSAALSSAICFRKLGGDVPLLAAHAAIAGAVESPAEPVAQLVHELLVLLLDPEHVDLLQVRLRQLEPSLVDLDHVHVALDVVVDGHREDLRLVVLDEAGEGEGVAVDLLEGQVAMLLVVALAVLQVRDRPFDRVAQQGERHRVEVEELGRDVRVVAHVPAEGRRAVPEGATGGTRAARCDPCRRPSGRGTPRRARSSSRCADGGSRHPSS